MSDLVAETGIITQPDNSHNKQVSGLLNRLYVAGHEPDELEHNQYEAELNQVVESNHTEQIQDDISGEILKQMNIDQYNQYLRNVLGQLTQRTNQLEQSTKVQIDHDIAIIIDRFEQDCIDYNKEVDNWDDDKRDLIAQILLENLQNTKVILDTLAQIPEFILKPQLIEKWYSYLSSESYTASANSIRNLQAIISLDERNKDKGTSVDIRERYEGAVSSLLLSSDEADRDKGNKLLIRFRILDEKGSENLVSPFIKAIKKVQTVEQVRIIWKNFHQYLPNAYSILTDPSQDDQFKEKASFFLKELHLDPNLEIEVEPIQEELSEIEVQNKTIKATPEDIYNELSTYSEAKTLLERYDFDKKNIESLINQVKESLKDVKDAQHIAELFQQRLMGQLNELLQAGHSIIKDGEAFYFAAGQIRKSDDIGRMEGNMGLLDAVVHELEQLVDNPEELLKKGGQLIADYTKTEQISPSASDTLILLSNFDTDVLESLKKEGIISATENNQFILGEPGVQVIAPDIKDLPWKSAKDIPETIILHITDAKRLEFNKNMYQKIHEQIMSLSNEKRPNVILYCDNFKVPLYIKHDYEGFMYASTLDEVKVSMERSKELSLLKKSKLFNPQSLEPGQKDSYDKSTDLREWEHITADTYQSLKHTLLRINQRNQLLYERYRTLSFEQKITPLMPQKLITTILDLGTGEGRIGQTLARLGFNVVGLDISEEILKRGRVRLKEEGEGLRGEREHPGLTYEAIRKLQEEDQQLREEGNHLIHEGKRLIEQGNQEKGQELIEQGKRLSIGILPLDIRTKKPVSPILEDSIVEKKYLTTQGSFFKLQNILNNYLIDWVYCNKVNQDIDEYQFFDKSPKDEYAFKLLHNMFADVTFDMALFNWHTFCEIGTPDNQKVVLHQLLNVMTPGGELVIEIPDRMMDPYIQPLEEYHSNHPDEPFGTLRDPKPDENGNYPPRYFPDAMDLISMLKAVGFEIDNEEDLQSYIISHNDSVTNEVKPTLKEFFITARKSRS